MIDGEEGRVIESKDPFRPMLDRMSRPPGPVLVALSVVISVGLTCSVLDWWPFAGHGVDAFINSAITVVLGTLLVVVGCVWTFKCVQTVRAKRWTWWMLGPPVVVILSLFIAVAFPRDSFMDTRDQFDALATTSRAEPGTLARNILVGPFEISRVVRTVDGSVYFFNSDRTLLSVSGGWVFSPYGQPQKPEGYSDFDADHIDGPWFEFSARQ